MIITHEGALAFAWLMYFSQAPVFRNAALKEAARERGHAEPPESETTRNGE